jgi:hypothetical protein
MSVIGILRGEVKTPIDPERLEELLRRKDTTK